MKPDQIAYHFRRIHSSVKFLTGMLDDILSIESNNVRKVDPVPFGEELASFREGVRNDAMAIVNIRRDEEKSKNDNQKA